MDYLFNVLIAINIPSLAAGLIISSCKPIWKDYIMPKYWRPPPEPPSTAIHLDTQLDCGLHFRTQLAHPYLF